MQIYKATFEHPDWRHNKCSYIVCDNQNAAAKRAEILKAEYGAAKHTLEYYKEVHVA